MAHYYEINEAVFQAHPVWGTDRVVVEAAVVKDGAPVVVRDSGTTNERPVYDAPNGTVIPQPLATVNGRIEGYVQGEAPVDLVIDYGQPDEYTQRWTPPQTGPTGSSTALDVSDYPLIPPEADDSGRFERWQAAAIAQGRDMSNYEDLVVNGVSILSEATILGPGKLIVSENIGQAAPLYTPPGSHDIHVYCELDGNKANIAGDPDATENPQNLWFVDGTVANPCERIYYAGHAHDSKRQGVVFRNVQQGGLYGLIENNDRDGATLYQNCRDIDVGLILSNCGDDHFAINSGELDQIGLCEGITGWVIVRGPSDRAKGRAVTVRGGRGIHLNIMATDPSQSALVLNNFGDVPLTDFHFHVQAYRPGQGGGAGAEKHGVMLEVGDGGGYIGNGKVTGRITGALDTGVIFVNSKGAPARGDFRGLEIDLEVDGAGNDGINADALGIDDCLIDGNVHGCGGWGFSKTSLGYRNRIRGDYYNNANGVRARVQGDGEIDVRTFDTRAGAARTQHVGLNIALLFDHFKLDYASWGNIDQDVQDDGGHVATWVRPDPAGHHGTHEPGGTDPMAVDAAVGVGSLRTLGYTATKAMPGNARLDQLAAPTAPVAFGGQRATGSADPTAATDLVTKQYADTLAQGLQQHPAVRAASIVNQALGAAGSRTVDGVALAAGQRCLLKAQTAPAENGIYVVNADFSLTRAADANAAANLKAGATVWVTEGATNADTAWTLVTDDPITIGTTAQSWTQSSALGQVVAGTGLTKTGSRLDVSFGAAAGTAAQGNDPRFQRERLTGLELLDWYGHSYTVGANAGGDRYAYVERLAHALGARRRNNRGWSAAVACWPQGGVSGDGGMAWLFQQTKRPGMSVSPDTRGAPYLPRAQVVGLGYGVNDIAKMGGLKSRPFIEAMRAMMHRCCAAGVWEHTDAAWAFTGTWTTATNTNLFSGGTARQTTVVGSKATWTLPADYPGGLVVGVLLGVATGAYTLTIGVKVDGVATADYVVDGTAQTDSENAKHNEVVIRFDPVTYAALQGAGAHTIELEYKSSTGTPQAFIVDAAAIEADPLDGPVLVVPNINRAVDYSAYPGAPHGPSAGTDPITDASVALYNVALTALVAEFPGRTVYPDIDTALGKDALNFTSDKLHPNARGHGIIAATIRDALLASGYVTSRLLERCLPDVEAFYEPVGTVGRVPFLNSWVNFGASLDAVGFHRRLDGIVELRGWAKSGSSAAAAVFNLPAGYRPALPRAFFAVVNGNGAGVVNVSNAGNANHVTGNTTAEAFNGIAFRAEA